jgi:hypothetical protein
MPTDLNALPGLRDLSSTLDVPVDVVLFLVAELGPRWRDRHPQRAAGRRRASFCDLLAGTLHRQLDDEPDAAYLVDTDGVVMFRALWANDPGPLREALRVAAAGTKGPLRQSERKVPALLRGTGTMWQTLSAAGPMALRDVARHAPPMWMSARLAHAVRPLPPIARGVLGTALSMAPLVGAAVAWREWRRRR